MGSIPINPFEREIMLRKEMEDSDADLGYIKRYIPDIHDYLLCGNILDSEDISKIKQAHELIQSVFAHVNSKMNHPKKFPD